MKAFILLASLASDNAAELAKGDVLVQTIIGSNAVAQPRYLRLYDLDRAPTVADVPDMTIRLPASSDFAIGVVQKCDTGLWIRITGAPAHNDATPIGAGDIACLNIVMTA